MVVFGGEVDDRADAKVDQQSELGRRFVLVEVAGIELVWWRSLRAAWVLKIVSWYGADVPNRQFCKPFRPWCLVGYGDSKVCI